MPKPNRTPPGENQRREAIWLQVSEVRFETAGSQEGLCSVKLAGDREEPRSIWWPVAHDAIGEGGDADGARKTYKAILNELDKKRLVTAWLGSSGPYLECKAFRFQAPDLGSR